MPKVKSPAKAHTSTICDQELDAPSSHKESASSDHESENEVSFHPSRSQVPIQALQTMFMPYIEGPRMDWTVNDSLYHRFLKWRLKCKNILECELVVLPEPQQCKKVITWSGDFGMDQYVSWSLTKEELKLDTIWNQFEEFFKSQSNKVHARFYLLTIFHQWSKGVDEWYNTVQVQVNLTKYLPETAKILNRDIFWFFLHDEDFVSKNINEGSVDLDKFPASKVCQLAKKHESSKATARHIRQVAGEMQATQIHLMRHQCTELPNGKYIKQKPQAKPRPMQNKNVEQKQPSQYKKSFDPRSTHKQKERCSKCGDSAHLESFQCTAKRYHSKACHKYGHFTCLYFVKTSKSKHITSPTNQKHIS